MARVKLGFSRLSVANKILTARSVVAQMTLNATSFPTPNPDLLTVTDATNALEAAAQAALKGGTDKTLAKHLAEQNLNQLMSQLQDYVQSASQGDPLVIESSGMEVRNNPTPASLPGTVLDARASVGSNPGEIQLNWGTVKGAKSYVVEMQMPQDGPLPPYPTPDNPDPVSDDGTTAVITAPTTELTWIRIDTITRSRLTVKNLNTGTVYGFRIAAINAAGQGGYSQVVSSVAP